MPIRARFSPRTIFTRKVGQTDGVCDVQLGFISRSVRARLQVSVSCRCDLCRPGYNTQTDTHRHTDRQRFDQLDQLSRLR